MKQFRTILAFELGNYFRNKVFAGITIFLVVLIAGVMFFPRIETWFAEDNEGAEAQRPVMLVSAGENGDMVEPVFAAAFPDYDVQLTDGEASDIQNAVSSGQAECAFVLDDLTTYTYYVDTLSLYDQNTMIADEALRQVYTQSAMISAGLTQQEAAQVLSQPVSHTIQNLGEDQAQNFFYTYIMIFALYMVIMLYGQMVATHVATEKSSRAMEVLITSAKPTAMMFGKVIASCLAGLLQLVAVFGSAFLFFQLNRGEWADNAIINSIFNMPLSLLLYMLLFFVLGFFLYAFMFGAVGSTASKLEDINTSVMPIVMLFVIAFIVVMSALGSGDVESPLMMVCSYIPFTSPMSMFTRIAMSTVPVYEIILSVGILIVSVVGIGVLSAKIYRVGVLLYGTTPKIGSILKALRKA